MTAPAVKKKARFAIWRTLLISLLFFLLLLVSIGHVWIHYPLPLTQGEVKLPGLRFPVTVTRDSQGVPHIEATNQHDLYMAQGYVTAQDRLFQMDLSRRMASGQLSEVLGKAALKKDRFFRTLGLRRAAELSYNAYSPEAKHVLSAYAKGVNAYMNEAKQHHRLPIEFTFIGYEPRPWTPIDSLTIGKYMAYDLGGKWKGQAFRYLALQQLPQAEALELFPPEADRAIDPRQLGFPSKTALSQLADSLAKVPFPSEHNGSNNWVVSGSKTATGKPLLANDPHLGINLPAIWYQTTLTSPDTHVSGVIFAGIPGIILGHNETIAWGVTNLGPDVEDLYIEKRNPEQPTRFLYKGKWEKAQVIMETILVKGEKPLQHQVLITRHGPVISEWADPDKKLQADTAFALRWTALDATTELEAVLRLNQSRNWDEFKQALTHFNAPAQNFVFASLDGTIAYRANGKIPVRKGNRALPVPGWTDKYEWKNYIPWEELPTIINPPSGFIATANHRVFAQTYPHHIASTWAPPYRTKRIHEVLSSKNGLTVADMKNLQSDEKNLQAARMTQPLLHQLDKAKLTATEREAVRLLEKWNHYDHADAGAPLVYHLWMEEIKQQLYRPLNKKTAELFEEKDIVTDTLLSQAARGEAGTWINRAGGIKKLSTDAFKRAVKRASDLQGAHPASWRWGEFHQIEFTHPLSVKKPLDLLLNSSSYPVGGSEHTVRAMGWDKETGKVDHGAPWRIVIDVGNLRQAEHLLGPGQSGQFSSDWYDDQAESWATNRYHRTMLQAPSEAGANHRLQLIP
ncbi:penicillin acylase family protein [Laceyella putida]|uniref:Penicillin acylase family protein n=1 Tax=Laceyella putida TaxID=110101 RepID=A0ABW2RP96_9BACL